MPPPFVPLSKAEFSNAIAGFAWPAPKTEIHVHHTWRPNHAQYRGLPTIQAMFDYHTIENHWSDIAQHVSVGPEGTIWTGRPWGRSPASAAGHNGSHVFMFETIGDFDEGCDPLTGAQLDSVLHIVATLQIRFDLPVDESIRFHNQMSSKTCPGSAVNRAQFVALVADRRAELEGGGMEALIAEADSDARAAQIMAAVADEGQDLDDGDAEHSHNEALDAYMEGRSQTPFAAISPELESAAASSLTHEAAQWAAGPEAPGIDALYEELGRRAMAIEANPMLAMDQDFSSFAVDEAWLTSFSMRGRRLFARIESELHAIMCGTADADAADRARLRRAFGVGGDAITAGIVTVLTGALGLAPAIAAVAAALVARLVIRPVYAETCALWSERLEGPGPAAEPPTVDNE